MLATGNFSREQKKWLQQQTRSKSKDDILYRLCSRRAAYQQHLRMERGKAPAHSCAPVMSHKVESTQKNVKSCGKELVEVMT